MTYSYDRRTAAELSVTAIARGALVLAQKLEKTYGFQTEVSVFKSGQGNTRHGSYVEMSITGAYQNATTNTPTPIFVTIKFIAGGYEGSKGDVGGYLGWREMAVEGVKKILGQLERQGWTLDSNVRMGV